MARGACGKQNDALKHYKGTHRLLDAARQAGASHVVYISIVGIDKVPYAYGKANIPLWLPGKMIRALRQGAIPVPSRPPAPSVGKHGFNNIELMEGKVSLGQVVVKWGRMPGGSIHGTGKKRLCYASTRRSPITSTGRNK